MLVRDALYENSPLIDAFIRQNPQQFSDDNLAIIAKWKQFIAGEFYVDQRRGALKDWRPDIDALVAEAQKLRSSAGQPPIQSPAFSLVKASLDFAQNASPEKEGILLANLF